MNTVRFWRLVAGGVVAASAILGAPDAAAQPDDPVDPGIPADPGNAANVDNPDLPTNANDARCIAIPFWIPCQGGSFGQVPGAFH